MRTQKARSVSVPICSTAVSPCQGRAKRAGGKWLDMTQGDHRMSGYQEWGEGRFEDTWLNEGFITMPVILLFDTLLSDGAKITYGVLCWHIWRHGKVPPQVELAEELGAGVRTIKRHLAELEENDYIERIQHGLGKPNSYIIKSLSSQVPKMALQEGQRWHFKSAKGGPSYNNALDFKTHKQQQQGRFADLQPSQTVSEPPEEKKTDVVVAPPSEQQNTTDTATAAALIERLTAMGVTASKANALVADYDPGLVYRWLCYAEYKLGTGWVPRESPAAWLVSAIRSQDWAIPDWFQTPEEKAAAEKQRQSMTRARLRDREQAEAAERKAAQAQRLAVEQKLGIGDSTRALWQQSLRLLDERAQMGPALLSAFLLPLRGTTATIVTPVKYFARAIAQNSDTIRAALEEAAGRTVQRIVVEHLELEDSAES